VTAAFASLPKPTADSAWVDRYEHLRKRGLELGSRWLDGAQGLVVVLRQGMVSWMTELAATPKPRARPSPPQRGVLVCDDRIEVTRMLASMVGSALAEVQG